MYNVNFEQYKVFYFVARNLSFSSAAKELFISQSAVSQSIKNLESRLNTALFIRKPKQIILSKEGQILYESVKISFNNIVNSENLVINMNNYSELKIAASDTISKYFLLPFIEKFNLLYPNIKIKILNKPSKECLDFLTNSQVDLAIINHTNSILDKAIKCIKVKEVHDVFIAGPKFSYLRDIEMTIEEIAKFPVLALENSTSTRQHLDSLMKRHNIEIIPEIETQSMGLLKDLARIGLGFAYITDLAVSKSSDLFVLNVSADLSTNFISIATLKDESLSDFAKKFIDLIKDSL